MEGNGVVTNQQYQEMMQLVNSVLADRSRLASALGKQFEGERDIYKAAGYKKEVKFEDYDAKYRRQDIAGRIVDAPADATWQAPPEIEDVDESGDSLADSSEFMAAWKALNSVSFDDLSDKNSIWHFCHRADQMAGVGCFGVLLVGIGDGQEDLSQPLAKASNGDRKLLYLAPYDEGAVTIDRYDENQRSPRFNLPEIYEIKGNDDTKNTQTFKAHWSRVIHIAENLRRNEVFGLPRLEGVYNRLDDLEKVIAASGEAGWKLTDKGTIFSTRDGYDLPDDDATTTDKIDEFVHGLRRYLALEGMDTTVLGGEMVDPTGLTMIIIKLISARVGIPLRILLGSEAGSLASDQDERNWRQKIQVRQTNFAEPVILWPLISRLVFSGVLPPPSGKLVASWADNQVMTDTEEADKELTQAQAMAAARTAGIPLTTYLREVRGWDETRIKKMYQEAEQEELLGISDFVTGIEQ